MLVGVASERGVEGVDAKGQAAGACADDLPQLVDDLADGALGVLLAHVDRVDGPSGLGIWSRQQLALCVALCDTVQPVECADVHVHQRPASFQGVAGDAHGVAQVHPVLLEHHHRVHGSLHFALSHGARCLLQWEPSQVQHAVEEVGVCSDAAADQVVDPQHQQATGASVLHGRVIKTTPPPLAHGWFSAGTDQALSQRISRGLGLRRDFATVGGLH